MPTRSSKRNERDTSHELNIPDFIHIYKNGCELDWNELLEYLQKKFKDHLEVDVRNEFFKSTMGREKSKMDIARELVRTKVFDVSDPSKVYEPFPVEVQHEMELIENPKKKIFGNVYDGFKLQTLFRRLQKEDECNLKHMHIVFTYRSIATWERGDGRYHARTSVYGFPNVISLPGLVEAPAKPREFYIIRKALVSSGMARELVEEELKKKFRDRFIEHDDPRMTEIAKGYVMQAFFYHIIYEPFCEDKNCRLFNAHWQEDMMGAQLTMPEFCERHEGILGRIKAI